jgi:hypothetical protein
MLKEKRPRPKPALAHHHITIMMLKEKEKGPRPQPSGSSSLAHARYLSFISLKEFLMGFFSPAHSFCSVVAHIYSRVHDFVPLLIWARAQVRRTFLDLVGLFNSWYNVSKRMGL